MNPDDNNFLGMDFLSGYSEIALNGRLSRFSASAPEPSSLLLLGSGILGLAGILRKRMIT